MTQHIADTELTPREREQRIPPGQSLPRDEGLTLAIQKMGGIRASARELGLSAQAFSEWRRVPAHRILQVEAVTGIPRERLRPELYRLK